MPKVKGATTAQIFQKHLATRNGVDFSSKSTSKNGLLKTVETPVTERKINVSTSDEFHGM
jgi:hypothetical protein